MEFSFSLLLRGLRAAFLDAGGVALRLYRVMLPVVIGVKILTESGCIHYLALPLQPLTDVMGLPAEMGLVWAVAIVVNIYAALLTLAGMLPSLPPLSAAQATTLAVIVLIAHSLIVESRIARQCGVSFGGQFALRMGGATLCGVLMHLLYSATGSLQEPAEILLQAPGPAPSLREWAFGEARAFFLMFWIIAALTALRRFLAYSRLDRFLNRAFSPLPFVLGITPRAGTSIVVGLCAGLTYGSGVIIQESRTGAFSPRDLFCTVTFIGLAHSLIEDTLLLLLIGGKISGLVGIRLLFAVLFSLLVTRVCFFFTARASKP
jgi:hypothetical protein